MQYISYSKQRAKAEQKKKTPNRMSSHFLVAEEEKFYILLGNSIQIAPLAVRYKIKIRYEALQQKRERRLYQADTLSAFMFALSELDILNLKWTPTLWHTTVDKVIVNADESVVFHFKNGSEVEV